MECSTLVVFTLIPFRLSPWGFSGSSLVKNLPGNAADTGLIPGLGRSPEKEMVNHSTPVCLLGKTQDQRSLVGAGVRSPWGHKRIRYNSVTKQQQR